MVPGTRLRAAAGRPVCGQQGQDGLDGEAVIQEIADVGKHQIRVFTLAGKPVRQVNTLAFRQALRRAGIANFVGMTCVIPGRAGTRKSRPIQGAVFSKRKRPIRRQWTKPSSRSGCSMRSKRRSESGSSPDEQLQAGPVVQKEPLEWRKCADSCRLPVVSLPKTLEIYSSRTATLTPSASCGAGLSIRRSALVIPASISICPSRSVLVRISMRSALESVTRHA
jgi:hypothetical protein